MRQRLSKDRKKNLPGKSVQLDGLPLPLPRENTARAAPPVEVDAVVIGRFCAPPMKVSVAQMTFHHGEVAGGTAAGLDALWVDDKRKILGRGGVVVAHANEGFSCPNGGRPWSVVAVDVVVVIIVAVWAYGKAQNITGFATGRGELSNDVLAGVIHGPLEL